MKINWKQTAGALALSAMTLGVTGGDMAMAKGKSGTIKVDPVAKGKSGTIPPPTDNVAPTEKGIKDQGVKSCGSCGLTGREAAQSPVKDGATDGEKRKFNDQWSGSANATDIVNPPVRGSVGSGPAATSVEKGIKDKAVGQGGVLTATERRAHNGPGGTPPSTAKPKKKKGPKERDDPALDTSSLLPVAGGVAALAALAAALGGGGNDNPTSP